MSKRLFMSVGWMRKITTCLGVAIGIPAAISSCSSVHPMRRASIKQGEFDVPAQPIPGVPLHKASYIESSKNAKHSCSFVEFDGVGDYLDFGQHQHCWKTIQELADRKKLLLFIYCHGWQNNSQSKDVAKFNLFLSELANSKKIKEHGYRVHGVYLSWRGNVFRPSVSAEEMNSYARAGFDAPILDAEKHQKIPYLTKIPSALSYWGRKKVAEHKVSGVPITRSVLMYSDIAKKGHKDNKVVMMGHSFGALMLEQSVGEVAAGIVSARMDFKLIDLMLLVNSAAPSVYGKMLRDVGDLYDKRSRRPLIFHVTSKTDRATGFLHPLANSFSFMNRDMHRKPYRKQVFQGVILKEGIPQHRYYSKTPGHNPFLINKRIVTLDENVPVGSLKEEDFFGMNLKGEDGFFIYREGEATAKRLKIDHGAEVSYKGKKYLPLYSGMWIMQCDKEIISNHGDIWNIKARQLYAALFGLSEAVK